MDDRSLSDDLSKLISGSAEDVPAPEGESTGEPKNLLAESLKTIAGLSGGSLETAVSDFLNGGGELHEATRAAVGRGKTATSEVESLLIKKFNLSPTVARLVASLLVKLIPALKEDATSSKKKPRRKPKKPAKEKPTTKKKPKKKAAPRTAKEETAAKKKPKKKAVPRTAKEETAAKKKPKKKAPASKPAAKKKPGSKTGKQGTTAKKKKTRTESVELP
jgi:outer membrane biosynthesis protein TonB